MNSVSNIVQPDYSSLLAEYDQVMNYLFESSDAFAVVADLKKALFEASAERQTERFRGKIEGLRAVSDHGRARVVRGR